MGKKVICSCIALSLSVLTSACFQMRHDFDGTVYFNRLPNIKTEGHVKKERLVGYALFGLAPYDEAPSRALVISSGSEIANLEIETQESPTAMLFNFVSSAFGVTMFFYQTRALRIEGDYIDPSSGPAPLDRVDN